MTALTSEASNAWIKPRLKQILETKNLAVENFVVAKIDMPDIDNEK